jgi:hypothetical protein
MTSPTPQIAETPPRQLWRKVALIVAEVLLILVLIGLIAAILLPVKVGASGEDTERPFPRRNLGR